MSTPITILGSTGSIGTQALDVVARTGDRFRVHALSANSDVDAIVDQAERFRPSRIAMADAEAAGALRPRVSAEVLSGADGVIELAADPAAELILNAIVGAAGLKATLASLDAGRRVALANKESCVAGGPLVTKRLERGASLVPVDSEHASVHMCLLGEDDSEVDKVVLTASGGPFRGRTRSELKEVSPRDALKHPTWDMGRKITIDSATLMNKGLEVLEAHVLFGLGFDRIEVVCHPQSIVHCLVGFRDGSWKSSLSPPDMRVPISYAMGSPARIDWGPSTVDWSAMADLTFEPVDQEVFRCLPLAYQAGRTGGTAPAVLNAANEVAVAAFLDGGLGFLQVGETIERVLEEGAAADIGYGREDLTLDEVLGADAWARERTGSVVSE